MAESGKPNIEHEFTRFTIGVRRWWRDTVVATVEQQEVIDRRRQEARLNARYLLMISMSAGIAVLGLLQSSPAVVIGAMLLSPLMDPIMGLGFGLAIGDFNWTKKSLKTLALGALFAVLFSAVIVFFSPLQTVTSEVAARTRPNLLDLGIALFSAVAGAYAVIRGREGTIVGVAIATALMPPLAVVGFGLATWNWTVFSGALMLFVTNLVTIAGTAFLMAKLYGFRTTLSERQTALQFAVTLAAFVALAVPLGLTLRQIAWEAGAQRTIRGEVMDPFDARARLSQLDINWDAEPIAITATVLTPEINPRAEVSGSQGLQRVLGREVNYSLTQYQVGTSSKAAEEAQLAAARAQEEQAGIERAQQLAERLALVAGVNEDDVIVDRQRRHAVVRAEDLPGASLATYATLEKRIAATEPEWKIELIPPARALPSIAFKDGEPSDEGQAAIELAAWAAKRLDAPILVSGPADEAGRASELLGAAGAKAGVTSGGDGTVRLQWGALE